MAELGTVSGRTLVPDLTQSLNLAFQAFGTPEIRAERERVGEAREAEELRQTGIQKQLEIIATPGAKPTALQAAFTRLGGLDPAIAKVTLETFESGNEQAQEVLRAEAEKGARLSKLISDQPDFASKQKLLTQFGQEAIARGESPDRIIGLQNMDEDRLDLELQKMLIAAQDIKTVLTPTGKFVPVTNAAGDIIGQMDPLTGKVVEDPRAVTAPTPQTPIAKARADLKANLITQADFNTISKTPKKFQTDVGKLLSDKQLAINMFGEGSEQVEAINAAIESNSKGEGPKLTDIAGVRKEFTGLSSDFIKLRDAIGKVEQATLDPSAAGDLALIFNFMKILDPGSVVRESEFATAQNAAGVPQRIRAQFNRVLSGERLGDVQRTDFADTANRLFASQTEKQTALEESFRNIAINTGINPEDVIIDFIGEGRLTEELPEVPDQPIITPTEGMTATNLETGEKLIFRNGQWQSQ